MSFIIFYFQFVFLPLVLFLCSFILSIFSHCIVVDFYFFFVVSPVAADAARSEHSAADASLRAIADELRDLESFVAMDFGADRALAPLYKKCVSLVIRQYTYEVCFFDRATQREGHSSTSLGTWKAPSADQTQVRRCSLVSQMRK